MAQGSDEVRGRDPREEVDEAGPPETTPAASEEAKERARQGDEVAATRAQVEQTRAEMGETIDAIQERLEPRNLREQASAVARGTGAEFFEAMRNNPAPVATAGVVVLGLLMLVRLLQGRRGSTEVVFDLRRGKVR
jgi:hypothetical protein